MHVAVQRVCPGRRSVAWLLGIETLSTRPPAGAVPDLAAPIISVCHDDVSSDTTRQGFRNNGSCLAVSLLKALSLTRLRHPHPDYQPQQQPPHQLQLLRFKQTGSAAWGRAFNHVRAAGGSGPGAKGDTRQGATARRPAWLRYRSQPSTPISDTATLQELVSLAAAEAPRWNGKELAAAAMRGVALWRREGGAGAGRGGRGQRRPRWRPPGGGGALHAAGREGGREGGRESSEALQRVPEANSDQFGGAGSAAPGAVEEAAGGVLQARTRGVHSRRPPSERRLANLLDRLVRTATARLSQGALGPRELSTLLLSTSRVGWWPPGSLQLLSAFLDFGGERLRRAEALDVVMVLKVLTAARQVSAAGSEIALRAADLAPAAATAAAATLPRHLPSCTSWTLAELLRCCSQLAHPKPHGVALGGGSESQAPDSPGGLSTTPASTAPGATGAGQSAFTELAGHVAAECVRRRFIGFNAPGLVGVAKSLSLFALRAPGNPGILTSGGGSGPSEGEGGTAADGGGASSMGTAGEEVFGRALRALVEAVAAPASAQMAGASSAQWQQLLRAAKVNGASTHELEAAVATSPPNAAALPPSPPPYATVAST